MLDVGGGDVDDVDDLEASLLNTVEQASTVATAVSSYTCDDGSRRLKRMNEVQANDNIAIMNLHDDEDNNMIIDVFEARNPDGSERPMMSGGRRVRRSPTPVAGGAAPRGTRTGGSPLR